LRSFIALLICLGGLAAAEAQSDSGERTPTFDSLIAEFDPVLPGYGYDRAGATQKSIQEMALGTYLVATVQAGAIAEAKVAAEQLLAMRHNVAGVGWGLGFAWDAFGDGSINPGDTIYGVTIAIVVRGLFDIYDVTKDSKYKDAALEALAYYRATAYTASTIGPDGGLFWYSDQPSDKTFAVLNVVSMLMGQYARAYSYTSDADYEDVVRRCERYLWALKQTAESGIYWPYKYGKNAGSGYNDPVHSAFVVQGFLDAAKYLEPQYDITPAVDYLVAQAAEMTTGHQRLWGVGMMMYTLAEAGRMASVDALVENVLPRFRRPDGRYAWATVSQDVFVRHTAYLLAGIARRDKARGQR